jgi:hypothetical protein
MKKVIRFFVSLCSPSTKKILSRINLQVLALYARMKAVEEMPNKVDAIVELFKVISPIQDAGGFGETLAKLKKLNRRKDKDVIIALEALQIYFKGAGRNLYGINRTSPGEEVTADKVYLGDAFGLFTKTASYWLENQEKLEKDFRPDVSSDPENPVSNWWIINNYQCEKFVDKHTTGIIANIDCLKSWVWAM